MQRLHNVSTQPNHWIGVVVVKSVSDLFRKTAAPLPPVPSPLARAGWVATHQHRKGGYYRLISYGTNEADRTPVAIYDDAVGTVWVRPSAEFDDGRFAPLAQSTDL